MAHRYKLLKDFEHISTMTFLRKGDVVEYMRDLNVYFKVNSSGIIQIPANIVRKYDSVFQLLPPQEDNEYSKPNVLSSYTYIDPRLISTKKVYSSNNQEDLLVENGNYFLGSQQFKDSQMASKLIKMILIGIKNQFSRELKNGDSYTYAPVFLENITISTRVNENKLEDYIYRMIGNCFPEGVEGERLARQWSHEYQPALFYFLQNKY